MSNERKLVSRNKREGRYINRYCLNPRLNKEVYQRTGELEVEKGHRRAGAGYILRLMKRPVYLGGDALVRCYVGVEV